MDVTFEVDDIVMAFLLHGVAFALLMVVMNEYHSCGILETW